MLLKMIHWKINSNLLKNFDYKLQSKTNYKLRINLRFTNYKLQLANWSSQPKLIKNAVVTMLLILIRDELLFYVYRCYIGMAPNESRSGYSCYVGGGNIDSGKKVFRTGWDDSDPYHPLPVPATGVRTLSMSPLRLLASRLSCLSTAVLLSMQCKTTWLKWHTCMWTISMVSTTSHCHVCQRPTWVPSSAALLSLDPRIK